MPEDEVQYDPFTAEAAYGRVKPDMDGLQSAELMSVNLTVATVARRTRRLAKVVARDSICPRLAVLGKLGTEVYDTKHFGLLEDRGWAASYIHDEGLSVNAAQTAAQVPEETVERGKATKKRMMKCVQYHLEDEPKAAREIASIIPGTSHADLASDLARLAKLYQTYQVTLSQDPKHYRADDLERAKGIAVEINDHLAATPDAKAQLTAEARVKHLCRESYEEVRAGAAMIFRHEPELLALFPSLFADD